MAPGQLRLRDNDGVNEGRCQSLQFLATAGDRGCRLIQQTGNLAVCEFEGLQILEIMTENLARDMTRARFFRLKNCSFAAILNK